MHDIRKATSKVSAFSLRLPWLFKIMAAMVRTPHSIWLPRNNSILSKLLKKIWIFVLLGVAPFSNAACPDLTPFYPTADVDWPTLEQRLAGLMSECLENSEFFALYGAAQLNSGNVAESAESLERALLLAPENGAAQIDYAQALYLQGQLFSALELNAQLLQRQDLPANLEPVLLERERSWQALTRQSDFQLDLLAGYDSNLNSAPTASQIELTLPDDSIFLDLNSEFRPKAGPYVNYRLASRYRRLAPQHQHNLMFEVRGRASEETSSDLLQFDSRYAFIRPDPDQSWQFDVGATHLLFGGNSLYTATEANGYYQPKSGLRCRPYYGLTMQHQLYTDQSKLNALESKASAGANCPLQNALGSQQLSLELALVNNSKLKTGRPGGDRMGWEVSMDWLLQTPAGEFRSQLNHTRLNDDEGYNPLLTNGAKRWLDRSYLLLQYRRPVSENSALLVNLFHQRQRSNIELFRSTDTTFEVGMSLTF